MLLLLCMMGLGLIAATVALSLVSDKNLLAILTMQDVLVFIMPAFAAVAIAYSSPWKALSLNRRPGLKALIVVILFYIISIPAMNWLMAANEAMSLPAGLSGVEQWMRSIEDSAAVTTKQILDIHTVGGLIACILVVGVLAGLSEEMLFRGAMLRMMLDSRMGKHLAVWIVAIIFSAFHMQFYGFFPRMILGLWLGYLLLWSGSLWVPIIAHALNNSTVVFFSFLSNKGVVAEDFGDSLGIAPDEREPLPALPACRHITHKEKGCCPALPPATNIPSQEFLSNGSYLLIQFFFRYLPGFSHAFPPAFLVCRRYPELPSSPDGMYWSTYCGSALRVSSKTPDHHRFIYLLPSSKNLHKSRSISLQNLPLHELSAKSDACRSGFIDPKLLR